MNYCKWLSDKSSKQYRLPTEAEWEKAARHSLLILKESSREETESRIWPWGNEFNKTNANTGESRIGHTTPVGQFSPQGDSYYGCADFAGNVWEWCADWFDENEYSHHKDIEKDPQGPQKGYTRVLRGGSFSYDRWSVRCACRRGRTPRDFSIYRGFRVAFSSILYVSE